MHTLEDTYIVCIMGIRIPIRPYLSSWATVNSRVMGHTIVPDLAADRSGSCFMFIDMYNIDTKPSSRDDSLVDRLSSLTLQ